MHSSVLHQTSCRTWKLSAGSAMAVVFFSIKFLFYFPPCLMSGVCWLVLKAAGPHCLPGLLVWRAVSAEPLTEPGAAARCSINSSSCQPEKQPAKWSSPPLTCSLSSDLYDLCSCSFFSICGLCIPPCPPSLICPILSLSLSLLPQRVL